MTSGTKKSGEGGQTAVGLDPINEGVQPDVLQQGRAGMARQRSKSQDVRTATWNVSSMVSRSVEVVDALHRRKIDFCCAQETRWRGESARMLGANGRRYKFFWQGCNKGSVGVFITERWIDSVVNVVRVNERIMYVKLVIGNQIVNIVEKVVAKRKVCRKAWQKSKSSEDKHALDVAKKEVYTAVMTAQEYRLQEFTADLQSESGRKNCFRIAKQMAREGRDVISVCCMKNNAENVVLMPMV